MLQRFLQRAWYDRPVRTQLLVAVGVINLIAALIAGAVSILNTRTATKVEIEASLDVAQRLVAATVRELAAQGRLEELRDQLPVQLKHLRHVRIMFIDSMGHFTEVAPQDNQRLLFDEGRAPEWYAELVRPRLVNRAVRVVTTDSMNPVVIVGEPADEIAEAWSDFSALVMIWLGLELLILVLLYIVLGRLLKPLANLSHGMANLESGDYATRLPLPKVRELAVITHSFNTLAGALDVAQEENSNLYRQLLSVQESERREIANALIPALSIDAESGGDFSLANFFDWGMEPEIRSDNPTGNRANAKDFGRAADYVAAYFLARAGFDHRNPDNLRASRAVDDVERAAVALWRQRPVRAA